MSLINGFLQKLQRHPKRIVFPEGNDPRIIQAARLFATRKLGVPVLLGDRQLIKATAEGLHVRLDGIRILEPERSDDMDLFVPMVDSLPRFAQLSLREKQNLLLDKDYFAAFMLASGRVDALVSGATHHSSAGLRALFRVVPLQPGVTSASSMLILDQENPALGVNGVLFLADCGVIPEPTAVQLADIAVSTARIARHLTNVRPKIALLSFATRSGKIHHPSIERIRQAKEIAVAMAAQQGLELDIDGELQLDAALSPIVAQQKNITDSAVAGAANVLVFPDLNSGNIAAKMIQVVAGTRSYGQILTGLRMPCAEISRGAHAHDVFGTAVITCIQAIDREFLFGKDNPSTA